MPTVLANLSGDLSDILDQDFEEGSAQAFVRIRANTLAVRDPDNNKVRVLEPVWRPTFADGTFTFPNLIAAADTVVEGTLQYWLDIKIKGAEDDDIIPLGPYDLSAGGDLQVAQLDEVPEVEFGRAVPVQIDQDILAAAMTYMDNLMSAHLSDLNPHVQYMRVQDVTGNPIQLPVVFARPGDPFTPPSQGCFFLYAGG